MSATIEIRVRVPGCRIDINIDRPTLPEALTDAIRLLTASTQGVPEAATAPGTHGEASYGHHDPRPGHGEAVT